MLQLNPQHEAILKELGRTEYGRSLVEVLTVAKEQYSSIKTIDKSRDMNAQVEGREIMCGFIDDLIGVITTQRHKVQPRPQDNFE